MTFDPNAPAQFDGIFGLPYKEEARVVLIPVPWEATTSYGGGTSKGPKIILEASRQVDLYDPDLGNFYEAGLYMEKESKKIREWNKKAKALAHSKRPNEVNKISRQLNELVYQTTKGLLDKGKIVGLVGGDHSSSMGTIQAYLEKHPQLGILHFDAHADLRCAFEGFTDSHASIMYNVLQRTALQTLVQVGIRDLCQEEKEIIDTNKNRVFTFFDGTLKERQYRGESWDKLCNEIIKPLPKEVYISFDIDGLDPAFCPNTGTPVPGGLSFSEALFLIKTMVQSGRKVIGFDLTEVSAGKSKSQWDANVGARLLYKLCGWATHSNAEE